MIIILCLKVACVIYGRLSLLVVYTIYQRLKMFYEKIMQVDVFITFLIKLKDFFLKKKKKNVIKVN